jgi:hypothetical protein
MRPTRIRIPALLFALFAAAPLFAAIAADVTLPVAGYLNLPNDLVYRTELTVTNYRDVLQYVQISLISDGYDSPATVVPLHPLQTLFLPYAGFAVPNHATQNYIGALRLRALTSSAGSLDPEGQIEANAFVIAERGGGKYGTSRQEVAGIPSDEYAAREAVFLGVRHSPDLNIYTNVGVVNLDTVRTETFYVQFEYQAEPQVVVVPPLSMRSIRILAGGSSGRHVRVWPEWSVNNGTPLQWVAYASTVDGLTGDAFSGMRVPAASHFNIP